MEFLIFELNTEIINSRQQLYMYEGKKVSTDTYNNQIYIKLRDNANLGDLKEVGYYDV